MRGLHKSFGKLEVLRGVSFEVKRGEVMAIIGPSGSGKSTLLRCLNFLEEYQAGEVLFDNTLVGYRSDLAGRRRLDSESNVRRFSGPSRHGVPELQPVSRTRRCLRTSSRDR